MNVITMYDSVPEEWPADAPVIAAYIDGRYSDNYAHAAAKVPGAVLVSITVFGNDAQVGDVESGCMWPNSQGAAWAEKQLAHGRRPTLYTFMSNWGPLQAACTKIGLSIADIDWWVAKWDGVAEVPDGAVAKQFYSDNHIDVSVCRADWAALAPLAPGPAQPSFAGDEMFIVEDNGDVYWSVYEGQKTYWRLVPKGLVQDLPPGWLVKDPNGSWLGLWEKKPA